MYYEFHKKEQNSYFDGNNRYPIICFRESGRNSSLKFIDYHLKLIEQINRNYHCSN